jgi:ribosomal protein S18 acetylase RimI-like enzyme
VQEREIMNDLVIRPYQTQDEAAILELWLRCNLVVPQNNPERDINRKLQVNPEWFLVGVLDGKVVATCMAGYEGHRGWINYLAVSPKYRRQGIGMRIMEEAENRLRFGGCPKINLQVRETNQEVIRFYTRIGYTKDPVVSMGKRLEHDEPATAAPSKDQG